MTTKPDSEDRQNKGLDHDASRHGGDQPFRKTKAAEDDPRDGSPAWVMGWTRPRATRSPDSGPTPPDPTKPAIEGKAR